MYNQPQNKTQQAYKLKCNFDHFQEFAEGEHDNEHNTWYITKRN